MQNNITPLALKIELHAYDEVYNLSDKSINNWKEIEITLKRDGTSGVFHEISFPFEFVLEGYDALKAIFDSHTYRATADIYIYLRANNWAYQDNQYSEPQIFNLDFTTYQRTDTQIEIETKRASLYDFIKAKNKVVYDIPVSEVREAKKWNFERIELENILTELAVTDRQRFYSLDPNAYYHPGISYKSAEIVIPNKINEQTVAESGYSGGLNLDNGWFLQSDPLLTKPLRVRITGLLEIPSFQVYDNPNWEKIIEVGFFQKWPQADSPLTFVDGFRVEDRNFIGNVRYNIDFELMLEPYNESLQKGDRLYFLFHVKRSQSNEIQGTFFDFEESGFKFEFKVSYQGKKEAIQLDLIQPNILLQNLVNKMTDSQNLYITSIDKFVDDDNTANQITLCAAESIRDIADAKVHTSYREFTDWMNTYGFEQHITANTLVFRKRNKSYRADLIAMELSEQECADLEESVNSDYLYSGLEIGYNKKEIQNVNGRFEFNGTHNYASELSLGDNILKLISPYRADCYGIEFLAHERGRDTTDDKADKDLFLVNVLESTDTYKTLQSTFAGNYPNKTIFNGNLNPYQLMRLNQDLLGVALRELKFTASDSNAQIIIDQQAINQNYELPDDAGLFAPIVYNLASRNIQQLPSAELANGIVRFVYKGEVYQGYIDEIAKNPAWETETTWTLFKAKHKDEVIITPI